MQTGPVAIIDGLLDGQYIPPGSKITLDGSQSFDYDDDIVLYQWTTGDGQTIGTREIMEVEFTQALSELICWSKTQGERLRPHRSI